jgi:2-polyprenyl-3-methyl-5-hydroxy-6-metoxy-1,4-benzoquinol methylase
VSDTRTAASRLKSWVRARLGVSANNPERVERAQQIPAAVPGQKLYDVNISSPEFASTLKQYWYYTIELKPGLFTKGAEHFNVMFTRELLRRLDPRGLDICDIGTAEGMIPILLKRRGARSVVALDACDWTDKVRLVQQCCGENFEYFPRTSVSRAKELLSDRARQSGFLSGAPNSKGFDVVVLSGVLYHVFSPLHVLGLVRTLLKPGGMLILETAVSCKDEYAQSWVFRGDKWIFPSGTNTWFVSLRLLDHFLRFLKFMPIDCVHSTIGDDVARVAVAAVAVPDPMPLKAEQEWFMPTTTNFDYEEIVDSAWATAGEADVQYSPGENIFHQESPVAVDLHATVHSRPAIIGNHDRVILRISDID